MNDSLYKKIGGRKVVEQLVDDLYERILKDSQLSIFFKNISVPTLKKMQYEFFSVALGGDTTYTGMELSHAHTGKGIKRSDFARYVELLFETLKDHGLSEDDAIAIIDRMNLYVDDIVGHGGISG